MAKKKKSKLTTKPIYKNGYEAAQENKPRNAPHRAGTTSEEIWLAGYNAYQSGGAMPEEPRKKRTKAEMEEDRNKPKESVLPAFMRAPTRSVHVGVKKERAPLTLDKIFALKDKIKDETDVELLEVMHMELADLEWLLTASHDEKPSKVWEAYKKEHGLDFERTAA